MYFQSTEINKYEYKYV